MKMGGRITMHPTKISGSSCLYIPPSSLPLFFFPKTAQVQLQPLHHQQPGFFSTIHWPSQAKQAHPASHHCKVPRLRDEASLMWIFIMDFGVFGIYSFSIFSTKASSQASLSNAFKFLPFLSSSKLPDTRTILNFCHSSNSCADAG